MAEEGASSDLVAAEDSILDFLNADYDLIDLEADIVEGPCPAEHYALCAPGMSATWRNGRQRSIRFDDRASVDSDLCECESLSWEEIHIGNN